VIALTYIKGIHYNECCKIIDRYSNYEDFKKNAFNVRQGDFFEINDSKEISNLEKAEQQIELAAQKDLKIISI
jgi:ribosomal protein S13